MRHLAQEMKSSQNSASGRLPLASLLSVECTALSSCNRLASRLPEMVVKHGVHGRKRKHSPARIVQTRARADLLLLWLDSIAGHVRPMFAGFEPNICSGVATNGTLRISLSEIYRTDAQRSP